MVNKVILVGRLGKDPECRTAQSGKNVCRFTMATDSGFGASKKTDWHNVVCFDKQADFCKNYLRKGSLIYVEGRISYGEYEKDGVKRYTTDIRYDSRFFFLPIPYSVHDTFSGHLWTLIVR